MFFVSSAGREKAVQDVVLVGLLDVNSLGSTGHARVCLLAMMSFSIGKPIRFANHPARASPKFPEGIEKTTLEPLVHWGDLTSWK